MVVHHHLHLLLGCVMMLESSLCWEVLLFVVLLSHLVLVGVVLHLLEESLVLHSFFLLLQHFNCLLISIRLSSFDLHLKQSDLSCFSCQRVFFVVVRRETESKGRIRCGFIQSFLEVHSFVDQGSEGKQYAEHSHSNHDKHNQPGIIMDNLLLSILCHGRASLPQKEEC